MFATVKGVQARSRPITYQDGATQNVDLSFLFSIAGRMAAPVVRELVFEFSGSISGTTGGHAAADAAGLFSRVVVKDMGGIIHDLPGKLMRERMIHEYGERGSFMTDLGGAVASGATNASYRFELRIPFDRENSRNGADTALPLNHLNSGSGSIEVTFSTAGAANTVVNSGTVTMYAVVHDEKNRELKSRLIVKSVAVTNVEDDYQINGSCSWLVLTGNQTATGQPSWAIATYPTIDVPELEYSQQSTQHLGFEYVRCRLDRSASDPVTATTRAAIPLIWSSAGQRIDKLPNIKSVRLRLPAAPPSGAQLYMQYIEDRYPALAAEWMGFNDLNEFMEAANKGRFKVKLAGGGLASPAELGLIARRLPQVIA